MIVAVNARFLGLGQVEGLGVYSHEVLQHLVRLMPDAHFHFYFDRPYDPSLIFANNVTGHVVGPPARHPLLWKYWFDVKLPLAMKKIKADVFLSLDGFCSLTTGRPQVLVVHDLAFEHRPQDFKPLHAPYYRYYQPRFIRKASQVLAVSAFTRQDIANRYSMKASAIGLAGNGVRSGFKPLSFARQQEVKDLLTGGREYFLYTGAIHPRKNLVNLLKAFSLFKKRMQSSMMLVLAGRLAWKNEAFEKLLHTYKYKHDVLLTGYLPEEKLKEVMASAYALVYPSLFEGFGLPVIEAMACGVPVLTSAGTAMEEVAGDAALLFDPANPASIGDKLMTIYRDETLRATLVQQGLARAGAFSWEVSAASIAEALRSVAV